MRTSKLRSIHAARKDCLEKHIEPSQLDGLLENQLIQVALQPAADLPAAKVTLESEGNVLTLDMSQELEDRLNFCQQGLAPLTALVVERFIVNFGRCESSIRRAYSNVKKALCSATGAAQPVAVIDHVLGQLAESAVDAAEAAGSKAQYTHMTGKR